MEHDPSNATRRENVSLLYRLLVPRPIAWVATRSLDGVDNLAPFSFYGGVCADPPTVSLGIGRDGGRQKDTARNLLTTGQCVIHPATAPLARAMVATSASLPADESEFDAVGLARTPSRTVAPPRLAAARVALEGRLHRHLTLGRGPVDLLLVEIVWMHVADELLDDRGKPDARRLDPLARLGGRQYATLGEVLELARPD